MGGRVEATGNEISRCSLAAGLHPNLFPHESVWKLRLCDDLPNIQRLSDRVFGGQYDSEGPTVGAEWLTCVQIRGWNIFVSSLPYLSTLVGSFFGMIVNVANNTFYAKAVKANLGRPVPEARLPPMMLGGVAFAGGLFMFAYTSGTEHSWIGPVVGAGLIGFGFLTVFQAALNFLVDTFLQNAASAMASNVVIRCMVAGAFPLVADPMFDRLGVRWSMATLAFIASGLIPIP